MIKYNSNNLIKKYNGRINMEQKNIIIICITAIICVAILSMTIVLINNGNAAQDNNTTNETNSTNSTNTTDNQTIEDNSTDNNDTKQTTKKQTSNTKKSEYVDWGAKYGQRKSSKSDPAPYGRTGDGEYAFKSKAERDEYEYAITH